jgi:hypothetical protein
MDWNLDLVDWEAIGVFAATVMSGIALYVSTRGQRRADALATRSAAATERMAVTLERWAIREERHAPAPGVAWSLEHFQNDGYLLTNAGRAIAHDVRVEAADMFLSHDPEDATVAPTEVVKFLASPTLATRDDTVTVSWAERPGSVERSMWRRPLPPKPPR